MLSEASVADLAKELFVFFRRVDHDLMRSQVVHAFEGVLADIARERPLGLVGVEPFLVLVELFHAGEPQLAFGTHVRAVVQLRVRFRIVHFKFADKAHLFDVLNHVIVLLLHVFGR